MAPDLRWLLAWQVLHEQAHPHQVSQQAHVVEHHTGRVVELQAGGKAGGGPLNCKFQYFVIEQSGTLDK